MTSPLARAFAQAEAAGSAAFIPYMTAGFPDPETFVDILIGLEACGADVIEVGLPFSDPLADGPVIQAAARQALEAGLTPEKTFELIAGAAARLTSPVVVMTYYNPALNLGPAEFARRAAGAGAAGAIIPDLPPEEADEWLLAAEKHGLDAIFMVAPTTTPQRLERILAASRGFVYYVSLTGVTGAEFSVSEPLLADIRRVRERSPVPVAVGFGIAAPEQARALAKAADGVVVGSALVRAVQTQVRDRVGLEAVFKLAADLKAALKNAGPDGRPDEAADRIDGNATEDGP